MEAGSIPIMLYTDDDSVLMKSGDKTGIKFLRHWGELPHLISAIYATEDGNRVIAPDVDATQSKVLQFWSQEKHDAGELFSQKIND
mmetsp:Transcript_23270/g.56431  ORF Transcript_23270/g.56431 Transcript_23270/m.56431 type:complete len:86 (-) Transcript_23270:99-356(-)